MRTEHNFYMFSASTIAAASIAASLNGMNWNMRTGIQYGDLLNRLTALMGGKQVSGGDRQRMNVLCWLGTTRQPKTQRKTAHMFRIPNGLQSMSTTQRASAHHGRCA